MTWQTMTAEQLAKKMTGREYLNEITPEEEREAYCNRLVAVVHARWEPSGDFNGYVCCSVCHDVFIDPDWVVDGKWSYCPRCGAKMDMG